MKSQLLIIAGLLLIPCLMSARATVIADEPTIQEECECLVTPTPILEKVSSQCSVEEKAPAQCFKVEKIQKTVDIYRIPGNCKRCCTITDENGTRPCGKECPKPCAPKCRKCCVK